MEVVDGVAPVVFVVPAEAGEAHADVTPGDLHARNVGVDVLQHRLVLHWQLVEVPAAVDVVLRKKQKMFQVSFTKSKE